MMLEVEETLQVMPLVRIYKSRAFIGWRIPGPARSLAGKHLVLHASSLFGVYLGVYLSDVTGWLVPHHLLGRGIAGRDRVD